MEILMILTTIVLIILLIWRTRKLEKNIEKFNKLFDEYKQQLKEIEDVFKNGI